MDMQPSEYIPVGEFISRLKRRGVQVTPVQLARWRREGLMAPAEQLAMGRGFGSVAFVRSDELERAVVIAQLLKQRRSFDDVLWRLWICDLSIGSEHLRSQLLAAAETFDSVIRTFKRILDDENKLDDTIEQVFVGRTSIRFFRQLRKRVGRNRFVSFFFEIMRIGAGQFDDISIHPELNHPERCHAARIIDAGFGLQRARTDCLGNVGPVISGDYSATLKAVSDAFGASTMVRAVQAMSNATLEQAKAEWFALLRILAAGSAALEAQFGKGAFGLRVAASLLLNTDRKVQAICVIAWAMMRNNSGIRGQTDTLLNLNLAATSALVGPLKRTRNVFPYNAV